MIDDLHEADPSTLQLLAELAPSLRSMAALVLVTARDADHDRSARRDVWGALNRLGEIIRLTPFGETAIAALLSQALGTPPPNEVVRTIARRTRGNPLLVCELIRSGSDLDDLDQVVPASVRAIVAARSHSQEDLIRVPQDNHPQAGSPAPGWSRLLPAS